MISEARLTLPPNFTIDSCGTGLILRENGMPLLPARVPPSEAGERLVWRWMACAAWRLHRRAELKREQLEASRRRDAEEISRLSRAWIWEQRQAHLNYNRALGRMKRRAF